MKITDIIKPKIKIGIDIDGTLTEHLNFFKKLTRTNAFEVYIITARLETPEVRDWTERWLKRHKIKYKELIMEKNKAHFCLEKGISLMFENDINELSMLHEAGVKVACLPDGTWKPAEINPTPTDFNNWWRTVFKISKGFMKKRN